MNKKIYIFYHICAIDDYENIIKEQFNLIKSSGLLDNVEKIYYGLLGNITNIDHIVKHDKLEQLYHSTNIELFEIPTINELFNFSKNNDSYILYIHTKGVTRRIYNGIHGQKYWRELMNYWNIEKYKECLKLLDKGFITVGINLLGDHYSGNFWWASTDFLKTKNIIPYERKNMDIISYRCQAEEWLLKVKIQGKHISLFGPYINSYPEAGVIGLYGMKLERKQYENKFNIRII